MEFEPGEKYSYSNSNYLLLALIVESVSGRTFEEALRIEVRDPLGLNDTGVDGVSREGATRARGYLPHGLDVVDAPHLEMAWVHGAGAMVSTVADLQTWVQALAEGSVLPAAMVRKMWQWSELVGRPPVSRTAGTCRTIRDVSRTNRELSPALLAEIVRRVVAVAQPDRIVLFGSAARGELGPDSDVDLLIIKSGVPHRRQLAQRIHQAFFGLDVPVDVIVVTPEDIQTFGHKIGTIIEPALREGREVYAA